MMTDFQAGDRVSVEGFVIEALEPGEVMLSLPQSGTTLQVWAEDLTLMERPRRKLRVEELEREASTKPSADLRDTIKRAAATLDGLDPELRKTMAHRTRMRDA